MVAPYRFGGELATALRRLKFRDRPDIARQLSPLLADGLGDAARDIDLLVPVPLSWRRCMQRGYNQSDLLLSYARSAAGVQVPIERLALRRCRHTRPQPGLSARARAQNVAGAFDTRARHRHRIAGRKILLFDDVATTGATLAAAARTLLDAGAACVVAVCAARAE
jgi:ComF family protein